MKKRRRKGRLIDLEKEKLKAQRKAYHRKIEKLVSRAESGDARAEVALRIELEKNPASVRILKGMIKARRNQVRNLGGASPAIKSKKSVQKGNAFKPYQGGLPTLGKKK